MKRLMKVGVMSLALAAVPAFAQEAANGNAEQAAAAEEEGVVGWTPIAFGLATPVQLPWGLDRWDVYGLDFNLFYADAPRMYGLGLSCAMTTRDELMGLGIGGIFNYAKADVYGVRATIGANICTETCYGIDIGSFSYRHDMYGVDIELIATMQESFNGVQASLAANLTDGRSWGWTTAGGVNLARQAYGLQLALIFNQAEELHGCQIALVNLAEECPWGFQIGLINIIMENKLKVLPLVNASF